ncbi:MAG: restriction endonuclease subunit S [Paludibacteraceae bacterium]|nr:restriction endonuclease subunit S [Paludibacteraceae bacterium]
MKDKNNIPQGYKDSVVGIIPEEWEVTTLGNLVFITSGESPSIYRLEEKGKYPYIKVEDMNNCEKFQFFSREYSNDVRSLIQKGSIIFPKRGAAILNNKVRIAGCEIYMDSNMMAITPRKDVCGDYLYFKIIYEKLFKIADTSTIPQINNKHIIPYRLALPPLAEQIKIAEILCTWDDAIEKQSKLIEKLELRKRGLMQRLLTGKTRLPGFTEPWKKIELGEVFEERNECNVEYLPLLSITAERGVIMQSESDKKDISNEDKSKYKRICPNDIGYNTMRMWQGRSALSTIEGIVSPAYTIVIPKSNIDPFFISVLLKLSRVVYDFWTHSQGLVGDTLNCKFHDFSKVKVFIPSLTEQKAIASVLTSADKEIETQRKKIEALRHQKQGLMQQLLTGKTRVKVS